MNALFQKGTYENVPLPQQADYLMKLANIPSEYRPEMSIYLQDEIRKSGKTFKRLIELYGHPCTKDILGSSIVGLRSRIESLKPPILSQQEFVNHRKNLLSGIAAILGSGFNSVMKNELEYGPSGIPVGVGVNTRDRHPICDSALSGRPIPAGYTRKAGLRRKRKGKKAKKTVRRSRHKFN
jgi:hypothetical protein